MARDRQRSKQRQAERRARRLAAQQPDGADGAPSAQPAPTEPEQEAPPSVPEIEDPRAAEPQPPIDPNLAVGAPPQDEGHSESVLEDEPELDDDEHLDQEQLEAEEEAEEDAGYAPRGHRVDRGAEPLAKDRPRLVQFLVAVWAELQRVQWPDRQTLTTLTGVVLGFVLISGGYLGLLFAIFSRVIQAIL